MLPDFLLPYNAVDTKNPLFQQRWHHLRWLNSETTLRRYTFLTLLGIPFIFIGLWLIERLNLNRAELPTEWHYRLINLAIYAALIIMLLASLYSVPRIMGRFNNQFNSEYWDFLRLTPQYNSTILMSHDAIAQLRLWPFTAAEIGLRIAIIVLFMLNNIYDLLHNNPMPSEFMIRTLLNPLYLGIWGIRLFAASALIIEPIFRVRLIVALQLWIATRIRNMPLLLLTGFAVLGILHFVQLLVMIALYGLFQAFVTQDMSAVSMVVCFLPLTSLSITLFWALYRRLRRVALNLAYDSAFRQD